METTPAVTSRMSARRKAEATYAILGSGSLPARRPPKSIRNRAATPATGCPESPLNWRLRAPYIFRSSTDRNLAGGEGPWNQGIRYVKPGVLILGTNPVTTDAVATAVMGYDPRAPFGKKPFEECDNTLLLAESLGIGTADLNNIEVRGLSIQEALFPFS